MHYSGLRGSHWDVRMMRDRKNDVIRSMNQALKGI